MTQSDAADLWRKRLKRFQTASLTVAAFCQSEDVSQASFYNWRRKLGRRLDSEHVPTEDSLRFVPLQVASPEPAPEDFPATTTASIELPGGVRIRIEVPAEPSKALNDRGPEPEATR